MLEFFNASSDKKYTFKCCFPYFTHFFCALLVALQNHGVSLGNALKLLSKAIVSTGFKDKSLDKKQSAWIGKASFVASSDFAALNQIIDGVVAKCKAAKIPVGIIPFAGRAIPDLKQLGFQMIVAGSDVAFLRESVINLKKTLESN